MAYTTTTTSITSATSSRSKQATTYQYPSGNGVVITGSGVNSNTTAYLDVTTPGSARSTSQVSGGGYTITGITYLDSNNVVTNANAVSTTGGNIKISGTGFTSPSRVYVNNSLVTNVVANSTAIIATVPSAAVGNVTLAVYNSSNVGALSGNSVYYSGAPSWVSSGAISSYNDVASNIALQVSGDGTLTYSLQSGSGALPTGITLLSSGYLTGTATGYTSDSVVTFTLVVTDPEGQAAQQNFSYTVFIGDTYFKQTSLLLSADTANTFISDSSTNNFLVSRFGDTRPSRFSPYWPGGWSGYFDGSGDYLSIADNIALDMGANDFTVELWFYPTATPTSNSLFSKRPNAGAFGGFTIYFSNNLTPILFVTVNGSSWGINAANSTIPCILNAWNHLALVRNGTNWRLYVNGSFGINATLSGTVPDNSAAFVIGAGGAEGADVISSSYISNFRLVKGTALYTANFTPSTTALTTVSNIALLTLTDSVLADRSPNNFAITRNGDTRLTTFSPFNTAPYTFTANSNSVYFDGTGDYLSIADNTALDMEANDFTVELWFYPTATPSNNNTLFAKRTTTLNFGSFTVYFANSLTPSVLVTVNDSSWGINTSSSIACVLNSWNHVALVRNGTNWRLYINGLYGVNATLSGTVPNNSAAFTIGAGGAEGGFPITSSYISNFRVVKGTAVYTANFTPSTTALTSVANTSLLTCQSTTIVDNSSNNFTITVNGNPNVSIVNPFGETVSTISNYTWSANSYSASGYFDGTGDYLTVADNAALQVGSSNFTFEAWVYHSTLPSSGNYKTLWAKRPTTASYGGSCLVIDSSGNYLFFVASNSSTWGLSGSSTGHVVSLNNWTHLAMVRSGNNLILYKNGIAGTTVTLNFTVYDSGAFTLMAGAADGGQALDGYISNFRLLKGTALYTGPFIPPAAPLTTVANTSILTLQTDVGSNSSQFVDQSAQNNLITRNGNASQGAYSPLVPSTWSAYFDGSGDYLTVASNTAFQIGTGNYTFETWVYKQTSSRVMIMAIASAGLSIAINTSGNIEVCRALTAIDFTFTANISNNVWVHIAVSRSGTSLTAFLNGVSLGTQTSSTTYGQGVCYIGIDADATSTAFNGYLSNLRLLKGTALYTANFTPATTTISPIGNTSLLTLREPILADNSGNDFTITRNGDTKIVPFGPFSPQTVTPDSYSYRFSNASDYISTTNSNLALGTNNWTIESWVYPRFTANSGIFQISNVQYGLTNSNLNTVALGFGNDNKAIVRVANATYTSTGTTITANAWTHLALVKSSNVSKLYINGTLDSTLGTSGNITDTVNYTGTTNIAVGGYGSTSALANAYISNFRVVSNNAVYTSNFTVNVGPISAISGTTLLTCQANTIIDSSLANLTITANANVTPSKFNPFDETVTVGQTYSGASAGGSAYFDGSGDYLLITRNTNFLPVANEDFTFEAWVYVTATPGVTNAHIMGLQEYGTNGDWILSITSSLQLSLWVLTDQGSIPYPGYTNTARSIPLNSWTHIAATRSGTGSNNLKLFVNGTGQAFSTNSTLVGGGNYNLSIGADQNGDESNFTGYISNMRIVKGTGLYTSNFVPPAAPALPTTANTSLLLNFTNSGVVDATGRNVLETVNDARVVTSTYKYGSGSYYFDGTGDYLSVASNDLFNFGTGDFTIEVWAYINSINLYAGFIDTRTLGATLQNWVFGVYASGGNKLDFIYGSTRLTSAATASTGQWTHFAVTRSSGTIRLFINGVVDINTATYTSAINASRTQPVVGAVIDPYYLNGYIDDLRITNGYARYTANFTAPTAPFVTK
jgi:hypothetical protein